MKISDKYVLRELAGKGLLMPERVTDASLRTATGALRAITLSGSAFWTLKHFEGREFSLEDAVDAICYEAVKMLPASLQPDFGLRPQGILTGTISGETFLDPFRNTFPQ